MPDSTQTAYNCLSQSEAPPIDLAQFIAQAATLEAYLRPRAQTNHQRNIIGQLAYLRQHVAAFSPEPPPTTRAKRSGGHWHRTRLLAMARDNFACTQCGNNWLNQLEAHHIIPVCQGGQNEIDNLTTLCHHCHDQVHGIVTA